ncbi:MAG: cell wall-active antibiotics response protein [Firmicutes bacterium]|nr:cell wall-active antibiotics response protein [Candidatus Fermentithermobacillaceae bacterium]
MGSRRQIIFGLVLVGLGVAWLLNNAGVISVNLGYIVRTYWPVVFIIWGLDLVIEATGRNGSSRTSDFVNAGILLVIGLLFLSRTTELLYFNWSIIWRSLFPVILILIGWSLVSSVAFPGGGHWAILSGLERRQRGWKLESGSYGAIMGAVEMDATVADIPEGETRLDLFALMGGVDIVVPADVTVQCRGTALLGGIQFFKEEAGGIIATIDSTCPGTPGSAKRLVITARAIMGAVEIRRG